MRIDGKNLLLGFWILGLACASGWGAGRMGRQISDIPGMPVGMNDVAQDAAGYLWISSGDGLSRYDGYEIRSWGSVPGRLSYVATGPGGQVAAGDSRTGFFEVDGNELAVVPGPEGVSSGGPTDAVYDVRGNLWVAWRGRLLRRDGEAWVDVGGEEIAAERAFSLFARDDGGVIVGSLTGDVWVVDADDRATRVAHDMGGWVMQVHDDPRGPVAMIRSGPRPGLVRFTDDGPEHLLDLSGRTEGLVRRGPTYWLSHSTGVWAIHDDGSREFLSTKDGFTGFGNLSTDLEGGLWSASKRGLSHFPQPDTRLWTELSGLPHVFLRAAHPVDEGMLITSWQGPMLLDDRGEATELDLGGLFSRAIGCRDPWGGVWLKAFPPPTHPFPKESMLVRWSGGRSEVLLRHDRFYSGELACSTGPGDTFWLLADGKLLSVDSPGSRPVVRGYFPPGTHDARQQTGLLSRDDEGSLIALFYDGVCEAPIPVGDRVLRGEDWDCRSIDAVSGFLDIHETPSGRIWIAAVDGGVIEAHDGGWRRVPGELSDLHEALALDPSPSGGTWVLGWRSRWRVEHRGDGAPPVVVESLGVAHGVPDWENGQGLHETEDGTVWLPLYSGLVKVPPDVRRSTPGAPSVTVTSVVADGRRSGTGERLVLRNDDPSLEVRWSALSFRDPARMRYRMRLNRDSEWSVSTQPFVQLAGMASGIHRLELGASLDGTVWSDTPAVVEFRVRRPWFAQPWFLVLAALVVAATAYAAFRLRLAHLLRLERQRTRIAMDLHDEMGAGLGSAGLLVGLLGEVELDEGERRRLGERAAQQIRDLGGSLADIVWSLRPGTETLDALLLFLRQRAGDLFPVGGGARIAFDAPDPCPALRLSLPQRRNLQWIAVEAMHNAARHATASRIVVKLLPEDDGWLLSVRDNGSGFDGEDDERAIGGLGLESMRRRAEEIGAQLDVRSVPEEGTEISVRFRPGREES